MKNQLRVEFISNLLAENRGLNLPPFDPLGKKFAPIAKEISSILFPIEIANVLKNVRYLIVIPELNISSIPFYLLQPFDTSTYLIDRTTVVMAHSLDEFLNRSYYYRYEMLKDDKTRGGRSHRNYTATDTVIFTPESPLIVGNPDLHDCEGYNQLTGAEEEAKLAAKKLGTMALCGEKATKKEILKRLHTSEFIYLATHGVADAKDPLNGSHLVFTGEKGKCGFWTAREIQFDTLPYDAIVVLSACQTGLGKTMDAGIIGLGRAFIKAQASNVIMSLWSVEDKSTCNLMDIFTDELLTPQRFFPAENLRQAMLKYRKTNPNPAAWAAFIDMGTPYPPDLLIKMKAK